MPALTAHHCIELRTEADFAGFRAAARMLLAQGVAPEAVIWQVGGRDADSLWDATPDLLAPAGADGPPDLEPVGGKQTAATPRSMTPDAANTPLHIPRDWMTQLQWMSLHADESRHERMYRLLWRLQQQPALRLDALDAEVLRMGQWARAVRRDLHKMKAFVRFRPVPASDDAGRTPLHVAWFEPAHHIVEAAAGFFQRRFTGMRWAILTPRGSVRWEPGGALQFGPPARRDDAPGPDAGEALWLTYYRHTFNPARLKLQAMRKEMPRRYWPLLPEAALISELVQSATERSGRMLTEEPTAAPLQARSRAVQQATQPLRRPAAGDASVSESGDDSGAPVDHARPGGGQHHDAKADAVPGKRHEAVGGHVAQQPAHAHPGAQE